MRVVHPCGNTGFDSLLGMLGRFLLFGGIGSAIIVMQRDPILSRAMARLAGNSRYYPHAFTHLLLRVVAPHTNVVALDARNS